MVIAGKENLSSWIVTSLFICNYSLSRLYLMGGPARLFSFKERESSWLTCIFATPALHADMSLRVFLLLSFSLVYGVSRTATEKQNEKKKDGGETLFVPRRNADKSVWSPRRGRRLWKFRETGTSANGRETKRRTPSKAPTLGPTPALVVGIVCSRRCLRW